MRNQPRRPRPTAPPPQVAESTDTPPAPEAGGVLFSDAPVVSTELVADPLTLRRAADVLRTTAQTDPRVSAADVVGFRAIADLLLQMAEERA